MPDPLDPAPLDAGPPGAGPPDAGPLDAVLRAARAVVLDGGVEVERPAAVGVRAGRVVVVTGRDAALPARREVVLADDEVLLPGLVDTHVHLQDPGRPGWEGFDTGTRAAALGGVTTVVDMPLDCVPVTTDARALAVKVAAAAGRAYVDVGFWGGLTPANLHLLPGLAAAGVAGFKCFLADTGLPDFAPLTPAGLVGALRAVRALDAVLLVHAEDGEALRGVRPDAGRSYDRYLRARPPGIEVSAVAAVVRAVEETGGRAHVVHVSAAPAADVIAQARRSGLPITAETCPHYLALHAEEVPDGATQFAVSPPLRGRANAEALWQHLVAGTLDLVVSDHSPSAPAEKSLDTGDFDAALPGLSSLQLGLPVTWTHAGGRGATPADLARWMARRPAELAGLATKGAVAVGRDADFCVVAPDRTFTVHPHTLAHRRPLTPYAGYRLRGVVTRTWLAGRELDVRTAPPRGRILAGDAAHRPRGAR